MNNYREYDAYALSSDPSFRRWVLTASDEEMAFWTHWLRQNPDRAATVDQARAFIMAVQRQYRSSITAQEVETGVDRIVTQATTGRTTEPAIIPLNSRRLTWERWVAAAMLVLAIGLGWQLMRPVSETPINVVGKRPATVASVWIDRTNLTTKPRTILLADGSVVTLEPGSRLRYPRRFAQQRAVLLTGEAFFEVTRRPEQPFVVTTNDFTTTVLGTSFRVRSSSPQQRAFVIVQSGKVAVQSRHKAGEPSALLMPVVLTRNEQIITGNQPQQPLIKTPVRDVELLRNDVNKEQVFEDVAVATVFDALETQYSIAIRYDRAVLSRCFVNTSFGQENLRERLSAVCQAVGATYQIIDDEIIISSSGCTL